LDADGVGEFALVGGGGGFEGDEDLPDGLGAAGGGEGLVEGAAGGFGGAGEDDADGGGGGCWHGRDPTAVAEMSKLSTANH
jgi:hypothetical protein